MIVELSFTEVMHGIIVSI